MTTLVRRKKAAQEISGNLKTRGLLVPREGLPETINDFSCVPVGHRIAYRTGPKQKTVNQVVTVMKPVEIDNKRR